MAKLTLVKSKRAEQIASRQERVHRAASSEGEAAIKLLQEQGYVTKKRANGQAESACPFHEEPGDVPRNKKANFYVDEDTSLFICHSASCAARGNLQVLERYFGFESSEYSSEFKGKEARLREYEEALTPSMMEPFLRQGLTEETIRRFRFGWSNELQAYVIPYLESKRPMLFRYYNPSPEEGQLKYWWEKGSKARLFNVDDSVGDDDGRVIICEGELKAALLAQLGYAAVATPGASSFKDEWFSHFNAIKRVIVCFDNDNPKFHMRDNCPSCPGDCLGHNPGQEAATTLVQKFDWRGKNVLLPLVDEENQRKVDINEFFVRDGNTAADFAELAFGERKTPFLVRSLAEIQHDPPEESEFLIEHGILVKGGRLLVTGSPKSGKSIAVQQMALSLGAGIPYLRRFNVSKPTRVMILDRELSKRALFDRFNEMIHDRPGYRAAMENVLIDHDHIIRLDHDSAEQQLLQLQEQNGVEVFIFDTAYKFFRGDMGQHGLQKAFDTLDRVIQKTGCSMVLTHHHRKGQRGDGKDDSAHPDQVAGSFLWTGWPNATILINFLERRVDDPFNTVWHFTAFRDSAPPEPIAVYRDRDSIAYTAIKDWSPGSDGHIESSRIDPQKPTTEIIEKLLLRMCPIVEEDFLHAAATKLGVRYDTVKPYYIDAMSKGNFDKKGRPPVIKYIGDVEEETWEEEHQLAIPIGGQPQGA